MPNTAVIQEKTKERRKNIIKLFDQLTYRYGRNTVWDDWIYMCASSMSQTVDFKQNREDEYLRRINSYDKDAQNLLAEMFAELTLAFKEERFGDILGDIYSSMGMANNKNGQVFTPYHISKMMAAISGGSPESLKAEIENKGYIAVSDPCCGAGVMLVAFADYCMDCGINYQDSVLFVAQDIDPVASLMCYVQMSLLGMPGYIMIGNSLIASAEYDIWVTQMYFWKGFHYRNQAEMFKKALTETTAAEIIQKPEPQKIIIPAQDIDVVLREAENGQFTFDFAS